MVFMWWYTHFPGTGDACNANSSENRFEQTRFANNVCFVSKQTGSDWNAQRYGQCHNGKIIKVLTRDTSTESHTGTPLKLGFAKEQKRTGSSDPTDIVWVLSAQILSVSKITKTRYEFNTKMSINALSSVQANDSCLGLPSRDVVTKSQRVLSVVAVGQWPCSTLAPTPVGLPGVDYTRAKDQAHSRGE